MLFGKIHLLPNLVDVVWQKQGITFAKQYWSCPSSSRSFNKKLTEIF
jgi:hypothetical protein